MKKSLNKMYIKVQGNGFVVRGESDNQRIWIPCNQEKDDNCGSLIIVPKLRKQII